MDSRAGDDAAPTIVNSTVVARTREYLTASEVEALMAAARKGSRPGHRDVQSGIFEKRISAGVTFRKARRYCISAAHDNYFAR